LKISEVLEQYCHTESFGKVVPEVKEVEEVKKCQDLPVTSVSRVAQEFFSAG